MKSFLLVIDAQNGFMVNGVTDTAESMINQLLKSNCFDCVISSVYQNYENSNIIKFMGWEKLLTEKEQKLREVVFEHTNHVIYKKKYSAYSRELIELLKIENNGLLPECVFIVGFDIECCVLMTAADLFENGVRPIVLTKYCGASGGEEAEFAGIRTLKSLIGANNICFDIIESPDDIIKTIENAKAGTSANSFSTQNNVEKIIEILQQRKWQISFAESCTGGKIAGTLVDIPSASSVFKSSFVTYANDAKIQYLDVSADTIKQYGVVSEEVAAEMAIGVAKNTNSQIGVAVSGIAGPNGSTATKPVGMVCFGFYVDGNITTKTVYWGNIGRNPVRQSSVDFVYKTLLDILSK